MCKALDVSRSGCYDSRSRCRPSDREVRDAELLERIRKIHEQSRGTYGSPRVHEQLLREGMKVGKDRIARLMKAADLRGRVRRRFKVTTDSKHQRPIAPNTLNRDFSADSSDSVWCADITYILTASGWVYLAAIIDPGKPAGHVPLRGEARLEHHRHASEQGLMYGGSSPGLQSAGRRIFPRGLGDVLEKHRSSLGT